jgi:hypothetical protein
MRGTMSERGSRCRAPSRTCPGNEGADRFRLTGSGTLTDPRVNGRLNLKGASAYLPPAGIQLKDMSADVLFNDNRITCPPLSSTPVRAR